MAFKGSLEKASGGKGWVGFGSSISISKVEDVSSSNINPYSIQEASVTDLDRILNIHGLSGSVLH